MSTEKKSVICWHHTVPFFDWERSSGVQCREGRSSDLDNQATSELPFWFGWDAKILSPPFTNRRGRNLNKCCSKLSGLYIAATVNLLVDACWCLWQRIWWKFAIIATCSGRVGDLSIYRSLLRRNAQLKVGFCYTFEWVIMLPNCSVAMFQGSLFVVPPPLLTVDDEGGLLVCFSLGKAPSFGSTLSILSNFIYGLEGDWMLHVTVWRH